MSLPPAAPLSMTDADRERLVALPDDAVFREGFLLRVNIILGAADGHIEHVPTLGNRAPAAKPRMKVRLHYEASIYRDLARTLVCLSSWLLATTKAQSSASLSGEYARLGNRTITIGAGEYGSEPARFVHAWNPGRRRDIARIADAGKGNAAKRKSEGLCRIAKKGDCYRYLLFHLGHTGFSGLFGLPAWSQLNLDRRFPNGSASVPNSRHRARYTGGNLASQQTEC